MEKTTSKSGYAALGQGFRRLRLSKMNFRTAIRLNFVKATGQKTDGFA